MSTNNLYTKEAIKKVKELVKDIDFCMLATQLGQKPFHAVPMSTKQVDDKGDIWFLSGKDSNHNKHLLEDPDAQLIYSKPSDMTFLKLFGKTTITDNMDILKELYEGSDDSWFDGIKDPNLSAIKFEPKEAYYWEPKSNKFVTILKMGIGAITGNETDIGEEGVIYL